MTSTLSRTLSTLALTAAAMAAQAAPVTIGALSSNDDGSTNLITDTLNGREWVRWDAVKTLNYTQALAATASSGAFEGFQIARNSDAQLVINALLGSGGACTVSNNATCAFGPDARYKQLVGDTWIADAMEYVFFLSDNGTGMEVGLIELANDSNYSGPGVLKFNEWGSFSDANFYSGSNSAAIGWLLYRDAGNNVPEPGSIALVLLALAGAAAARRRQA